jgi:hypothetical protein
MAKLKHKAPMEYRVTYRINGSAVPSENYYSVFHSSEALSDLLHTLKKGGIHGNEITIISVSEWCRYRGIWLDRTDKALENTDTKHLSINGQNIKFSKDALTK